MAHIQNLIRVEPIGRLIQYHKVRIMYNRLGNTHSLLISSGKISKQTLAEMTDTATFQHFLHSLRNFSIRDITQSGTIFQIFCHRQIHMQGGILRQKADVSFSLHRIFTHTDTLDINIPFRLPQHTTHNVHRCGFPGSVGAE